MAVAFLEVGLGAAYLGAAYPVEAYLEVGLAVGLAVGLLAVALAVVGLLEASAAESLTE